MLAEIEIQERDLLLLRSLFESRIMTTAQVAVLHFQGKREATKKRLQKVKAAGLIYERKRRVSEPSVLSLTTKGFKVLQEQGILNDYPAFDMPALEKRARVSEMTIRHELEVMDVKAAFHFALRERPVFRIEEFTTWPLLYQFAAGTPFGREILVKPDGFIRIHEDEPGTKGFEHTFFLEVDRSSEVQETLAKRAACYSEYFKSGGFAEWSGGTRDKPQEFPFRVLFVFKTAERRNNLAERLLQSNPPILKRAWLTTQVEVNVSPFGAIWIRPFEYREATKGTAFDPERERKVWGYKRQTERENMVDARIRKLGLFDDAP